MALVVTVEIVLALVSLFSEKLKAFFGLRKEGREMSEGRHRAPEGGSFSELRDIESMEPWRISHHVYQPISFDSPDQVAEFLTSEKRPGHHRREWKIWVPRAQRWMVQTQETVTEEEFMDHYLEVLSEKLRS